MDLCDVVRSSAEPSSKEVLHGSPHRGDRTVHRLLKYELGCKWIAHRIVPSLVEANHIFAVSSE